MAKMQDSFDRFQIIKVRKDIRKWCIEGKYGYSLIDLDKWPEITEDNFDQVYKPDVKPGEHVKKNPHQMFAIPRSLWRSKLWYSFSHSARGFYLFLLSWSDVQTFKAAFPSMALILAATGLDKKTVREYERQFVEAKLLKVYEPGSKDLKGYKHRSKQYHFRLAKWINLDYEYYNQTAGQEIYSPISDMYSLQEQVEDMAKAQAELFSQVQSHELLIKGMLDEMAKRSQINGMDDQGNLHLRLHSKTIPASFARHAFTDPRIIIFPEKQDAWVDPKQTMKILRQRINKNLSQFSKVSATETLTRKLTA